MARAWVVAANLLEVSLVGIGRIPSWWALRGGREILPSPFGTMFLPRSQSLLARSDDGGLQLRVHDPKAVLGREVRAEPLVVIGPDDLDRSPLLRR